MPIAQYPLGFSACAMNIGIKDDSLDFGVVYSEVDCQATAVFTKNNFPGAPILVGREHIRDGKLRAIVVNSKNANVATGEQGLRDSMAICREIAKALAIEEEDVLPSSTGVIGLPLPMEKILPACQTVKEKLQPGHLEDFAQAILTTDSKIKTSCCEIATTKGTGMIYGVAKGAGMIEPNMATMLVYLFTDVDLGEANLYRVLKDSVDKSFHCITIDSDTSTSDTVVLMCSGLQGRPKQKGDFSRALDDICINLAKQVVADGEGVSKVIELDILQARDSSQANKIGKSILNSPLIKTAIHGGDPNWGRFVMAIGKVFDEPIPYDTLSLTIGGLEVKEADEPTRNQLAEYLKQNSEIKIEVSLSCGNYSGRYWGCNLSEGYITENAYYTT